jgi:hypothetical protein
LKARKEYVCDMCGFSIRKGENYRQIADENDWLDTSKGMMLRPMANFKRIHDVCLDLIADGWEVPDDLVYVMIENIKEAYGIRDLNFKYWKKIILEGPLEGSDYDFLKWRDYQLLRINVEATS